MLIPFANRIRGRLSADGRTINTRILGREIALPANFGGQRPGAERVAMHGLILDSEVGAIERRTSATEDAVRGVLQAGDFGWGWPSRTEITFENVLRGESFRLTVTARNVGDETLPIGIGWHPYFALPRGRREAARLRVPARRRALVNDADDVLPTGEVEAVAGTPYDFSRPGGRPLGDLRLDDCFVDLETVAEAVTEVIDPAASYGLRVVAAAPPVRAIQVYAPVDGAFVAVEPQLNWGDPFGRAMGTGDGHRHGTARAGGVGGLLGAAGAVHAARLSLTLPPRRSTIRGH